MIGPESTTTPWSSFIRRPRSRTLPRFMTGPGAATPSTGANQPAQQATDQPMSLYERFGSKPKKRTQSKQFSAPFAMFSGEIGSLADSQGQLLNSGTYMAPTQQSFVGERYAPRNSSVAYRPQALVGGQTANQFAGLFDEAKRTSNDAYQQALAMLNDYYNQASTDVNQGYDELDSWLQQNLVNPYQDVPQARFTQDDAPLVNLLQSQGVDPAAYRAEGQFRDLVSRDQADAFNRMVDLLSASQGASNQMRMGDSQFARMGASQALNQQHLGRLGELAAQNLATKMNISLEEAQARVQQMLTQMNNQTQLQAAQIGANATLGAAKINADTAQKTAQMRIEAEREMQQAGFSHDQAMMLAKANIEDSRLFIQLSAQDKAAVREMQFNAAIATNDFAAARKIAEQSNVEELWQRYTQLVGSGAKR